MSIVAERTVHHDTNNTFSCPATRTLPSDALDELGVTCNRYSRRRVPKSYESSATLVQIVRLARLKAGRQVLQPKSQREQSRCPETDSVSRHR